MSNGGQTPAGLVAITAFSLHELAGFFRCGCWFRHSKRAGKYAISAGAGRCCRACTSKRQPATFTLTVTVWRQQAGSDFEHCRHLATTCDTFAATGRLPPSLFPVPPTAPADPQATAQAQPQGQTQLQPQPQPPPQPPPRPAAPPVSSPGPATGQGLSIPPASAPRPRKKRKQPGDDRRRRPPTGAALCSCELPSAQHSLAAFRLPRLPCRLCAWH